MYIIIVIIIKKSTALSPYVMAPCAHSQKPILTFTSTATVMYTGKTKMYHHLSSTTSNSGRKKSIIPVLTDCIILLNIFLIFCLYYKIIMT